MTKYIKQEMVDLSGKGEEKVYYRTMYNGNIRCIDLKTIDFNQVKYHSQALDKEKKQPIEMITIR